MVRIGFAKIFVTDIDAMSAFFRNALGGKEVARIPLPHEEEALIALGTGEPEIVLARRLVPEPLTDGTMYGPIGLIVENCDEALAACVAAGGRVTQEAMTFDDPKVRVAMFATPEGHVFELLQQF